MQIPLNIPTSNGVPLQLSISSGDVLYILGANGVGKSSLMHWFYTHFSDNARRILAHRQTWMQSNTVDLSPQNKRDHEQNVRRTDLQSTSRWMDSYSSSRPSISIYDLIDAQNVRARAIADAVDAENDSLVMELKKKDAPIKIINKLLRLSNLPIEISVVENEQVMARKNGSSPYSIAELSDGERNAILIASDVLTAKKNSVILIDEPERHLHRAIISPLLTHLFASRADCSFIVSTHEVMLPVDNPRSKTFLVRGCNYNGSSVTSWDADLVPPDTNIDESLKRDILGNRRKLLFIEGTEDSLDKALYSLIFPEISVIAKGTCGDVEEAVYGIRNAGDFHWVHAFGIVDGDGRTSEDVERLKGKGVYALSVFSVESIYYHPEIQRRTAERLAAVTRQDASSKIDQAKTAALAAIRPHSQRLSGRIAEKVVREQIFNCLPKKGQIDARSPIIASVDVPNIVSQELTRLQTYLAQGDLGEIMNRYPIRETPALNEIVRNLGFQNREQYEQAVQQLLIDDVDALQYVQHFFGTLFSDISQK